MRANFLFCSFPFVFAGVVRTKTRNQETKGVDFVFQQLGAKPLQRKPRNESTEGFEPTALSIPAHVLIHSGMASFRLLKRRHIHPIFCRPCNQPLPEPSKIRNRALQFLQFKKSSPSSSYFVGFFLIWQSLIYALSCPDKASKALQSCYSGLVKALSLLGKPRTHQKKKSSQSSPSIS